MSNSIALQTLYVWALTLFETSYNTSNVNISIMPQCSQISSVVERGLS